MRWLYYSSSSRFLFRSGGREEVRAAFIFPHKVENFFVNSATTFLTHFETGKVLPHHVIMVKRFSSVIIGCSSTLYIRGMDNRAQDDSFLDDTTVGGRTDPLYLVTPLQQVKESLDKSANKMSPHDPI